MAYGLAERLVDPGIEPIAQLVMIPVLMAGFGWAVQFSARRFRLGRRLGHYGQGSADSVLAYDRAGDCSSSRSFRRA